MELGVPGVVGSVVQEHEEIRSKNLEKLGEPNTGLSRYQGLSPEHLLQLYS